MELLNHFSALLEILPKILPTPPPVTTPDELAKVGIDFFAVWIGRLGGIIAFIGAVKLALSIKDDNAKEQLLAVLVMVSGFMIKAAVSDLDIFKIPAVYSAAAANDEFREILKFIGRWIRRVGALGILLGAVMLGLSMKTNDAAQKVNGLRTISSGGIIVAISAIISSFI